MNEVSLDMNCSLHLTSWENVNELCKLVASMCSGGCLWARCGNVMGQPWKAFKGGASM